VGRDIGIGHELSSCTQEISEFAVKLQSETMFLVDTPGFDDSDVPDILKAIGDWLKKGFVISGIGNAFLTYHHQKHQELRSRKSHLPLQD
jgi:predicted GTPase